MVNRNTVERNDGKRKRANQNYFNSRYGAKDLPPLSPGTEVLQKLDHERQWTSPATVIKRVASRSYLIKTPFCSVRRNRKHLRPTVTFRSNPEVVVLKNKSDDTPPPTASTVPPIGDSLDMNREENNQDTMLPEEQEQVLDPPVQQTVIKTKSGRVICPPARYGYKD